MHRLIVALTVAAWLAFPSGASAEKRVALLIGAQAYSEGSLVHPVEDANKVRDALVAVGFEAPPVLVDPGKRDLEQALKKFGADARGADVAVFYFAGHGIEYDGSNWLVPVGADLTYDESTRVEGVRLDDVVNMMKGAKFRIAFFDACRNNPFTRKWGRTRSASTRPEIDATNMPLGTLVAFSAASSEKSPDNGLYATALSKLIPSEGMELRAMLERVADEVEKQVPLNGPAFSFERPSYMPAYNGNFSFKTGWVPAQSAASVDLTPAEKRILEQARNAAVKAEAIAAKARQAESEGRLAAAEARAANTCVWSTFAGQCANGVSQGYGEVVYSRGSASRGESFAGLLEGGKRVLGVFSSPVHPTVGSASQSRYEGQFAPDVNNRAGGENGLAVVYYHDGSSYQGEVALGARDGFGVLRKSDGSRTEGRWSKNAPSEVVSWDANGSRIRSN